ncbi:type II toxin-antitoxin system RelE/ParE family toxin [Terrarubrum flagellatum]|uniref:type II toxin-antitoxin system RelE/ParE family toxin n=1 Tax=Terrirubrum flagellatum TaxID=2895980 RepID=UPI003145092E
MRAAKRDLESIAAYLKKVASKSVSDRVLKRIAHSASLLRDKPFIGRASESTNGVHELQVPQLPYLLPYRVNEGQIEILRVFHEAQDRPESW